MEPIGKLAKRVQTQPIVTTTDRKRQKSLPESWMLALFEKLRRRYGELWTRKIGETAEDVDAALREWGEVLAEISGEQIKSALQEWDSPYPPNVYEFRRLCRDVRLPSSHLAYKHLPPPPVSNSLARSSIDLCKANLAKKADPVVDGEAKSHAPADAAYFRSIGWAVGPDPVAEKLGALSASSVQEREEDIGPVDGGGGSPAAPHDDGAWEDLRPLPGDQDY